MAMRGERGIGEREHARVDPNARSDAAAASKTNARLSSTDTLGAFYQAGNMVFQTCEEATMSTERRKWTKFVEQREREKKVKRPRTKKQPETAPAELEAALDDLVGEAERGRARFSTLSEKAL
jgi:hypothetical protein